MLTNAERWCDQLNSHRILLQRNASEETIRKLGLMKDQILYRFQLMIETLKQDEGGNIEITFKSDGSYAYRDNRGRWMTNGR